MLLFLAAGWTEANSVTDTGGGFVGNKKPKSKDYYIVHKEESNQCSVVVGKCEQKPMGLVGDTPYASKEYAKAVLKNLPECKGGDTDESTGQKKHWKKKD
jgi:hypothetical protein